MSVGRRPHAQDIAALVDRNRLGDARPCWSVVGRAPGGSVPGDAFFTAPPSAPEPVVRTWGRFTHAWILFGVGFAGTLVMSASLFTQIVIGAPVFEELWKLGAALLLVHLFRVGSGPARVLVALVPGAGFGVLEHYLTYSTEPATLFAFRVVFHSGTAALSAATWHVVADGSPPGVAWLSTAPATVVHWFNNFAAVLMLVPSLFFGDVAAKVSLAFGVTAATVAHVGAWTVLARPDAVRRALARLWDAIPHDMRR